MHEHTSNNTILSVGSQNKSLQIELKFYIDILKDLRTDLHTDLRILYPKMYPTYRKVYTFRLSSRKIYFSLI